MHLAEGVIESPVVLAGGYAVALSGVAMGLRKLDESRAMRVAVLSSSFFVASLIHFPFFGIPLHLTLTGLLGILLGWAAFPAVFVALILQAVLFGFGGPSTLGLNTCIMAVPAVVVYAIHRRLPLAAEGTAHATACGILGALAISLATAILAGLLLFAGRGLAPAAGGVFLSQLPLMVVEGVVTVSVVRFLQKVSPELLTGAAVETPRAEEERAL